MKVKTILKFYFTAEETLGRLDGLIYKKAFSVNWARSAGDCAEEVAGLVRKKGELCWLARSVGDIVRTFGEGEVKALRRYALGAGRPSAEERRENHRLAVAFARRANRAADSWREGLEAAAEYVFFC